MCVFGDGSFPIKQTNPRFVEQCVFIVEKWSVVDGARHQVTWRAVTPSLLFASRGNVQCYWGAVPCTRVSAVGERERSWFFRVVDICRLADMANNPTTDPTMGFLFK